MFVNNLKITHKNPNFQNRFKVSNIRATSTLKAIFEFFRNKIINVKLRHFLVKILKVKCCLVRESD